ncbi:MAG: helix-turn-helix transcriptional regulator [Oscillospiraceae bacterium]|nr:helix-turn-helix transcriptional regulator [Oscillospiraceae bacterium]
MKMRDKYTCPLEIAHDMIKGKWKTIIIWRLRAGKQSLSCLKKDIKGINEKMLIQHLKELCQYNIVKKNIYDGYPLKVEYFITEERGIPFLKCLEMMQKIGIDYLKENGRSNELIALNLI